MSKSVGLKQVFSGGSVPSPYSVVKQIDWPLLPLGVIKPINYHDKQTTQRPK